MLYRKCDEWQIKTHNPKSIPLAILGTQTQVQVAQHPANTSQVVSIYTNQANNEEVRIYGIAVRINDGIGTGGATSTTLNDFAVSIQVGANNVPSNQFDIVCR